MKRFWLVLLSLGLIMAFSASAFAVDVKFSGSYVTAGAYLDKTNLIKEDNVGALGATAFYFQKLQLTTEFVACPGVSLFTRANIMERVWGAARSDADRGSFNGSAATVAENENIGFDFTYIKYQSPIGVFLVGYQADSTWGTVFANSEAARGKISYAVPIGNFIVGAAVTKYTDNSFVRDKQYADVDVDSDKYSLFGRYAGKNIEGGLLVNYYSDATTAPTSSAFPAETYKGKYWNFQPYAKAKVGPVAIQAELTYFFGDVQQYNNGNIPNKIKVNSLAGWVDALATFGPVYFGGTIAYAQGPDSSNDKVANMANGGRDWSPTLIMWNYDRNYWIGSVLGNDSTQFNAEFTNAWLYQLKGGVKPTDRLDIGASITFAHADNLNTMNAENKYAMNQTGFDKKDLGWEVDVTGTYKITNNLTYLLGFGYLFTGDYFKGNILSNPNNSVTNDYIILNKLTFTF
jgi:hypothetical protein